MTKNVLVTGCAGFIGFNLSKTLLKENHNVYGVDSLNSAYDEKFKELRLQNLESEFNFHFTNNDLSMKIHLMNYWILILFITWLQELE